MALTSEMSSLELRQNLNRIKYATQFADLSPWANELLLRRGDRILQELKRRSQERKLSRQ